MRFLFALALAACSSAPPAAVTLRAPPLERAQPTMSGSLAPPTAPASIAWQWTGPQPGFGTSFYRGPRRVRDGEIECTFAYDERASTARTACSRWGTPLWQHDEADAFAEDAALAIDHGALYSARISNIASGCTLHAFDVVTGAARWTTRLLGLGPIAHSEYLNAVELRVVGGWPTVFGWESAGRYIEAMDALTGKTIMHDVLPATQ